MINIEKSKITSAAKEVVVLSIIDNIISIDIEETNKRKKLIEELTQDLWS